MKPYDELTPRGQILRLRQLALQALADYPIDVARVRYLTTESTTMFRVDAVDGEKYVFRIYSEADSSLVENQTEMVWLAALARETDLPTIQPVARKDGEYISLVHYEGIPGEKRCALYKWIPGVTLSEHVTLDNYRKLGVIMAGLHNHAEQLTLPDQLQPKRWDKTYYFPGEEIVYNTAVYAQLYTPAQIQIIDRAVATCDSYLASLYQQDANPFLLHGDLHYWNVHIQRGQLYVLDFEDMLIGFPVHDIAISLYYLRDEPRYGELASAFQAGYASVRAWPHLPPEQMRSLWLARMTNFVNYAATAFGDDDAAREYISARCEEIEKYLT
jgi:Ser/Thr protein kinase RdoA (MazF antagonist)